MNDRIIINGHGYEVNESTGEIKPLCHWLSHDTCILENICCDGKGRCKYIMEEGAGNEYVFKVYFKDNKTGVPFVVPVNMVSSTLEAAKQKVFVESHLCEDIYNCKLLYIYYDTDMKTVLQHDLERRCKHED